MCTTKGKEKEDRTPPPKAGGTKKTGESERGQALQKVDSLKENEKKNGH